MLTIGIDPGQSGGITVIGSDGVPQPHKMPDTEADTFSLLRTLHCCGSSHAFLEFVTPMPKQGICSTWKFGQHYGLIRGILTALEIPWETVRPQKWQQVMGCLSKGNKDVTKSAAQRLWPSIKWTHATADSALIAEFGRQVLHSRGLL